MITSEYNELQNWIDASISALFSTCLHTQTHTTSQARSMTSISPVSNTIAMIFTTYFENKFKSRWQASIKALIICKDTWLFLKGGGGIVTSKSSIIYAIILIFTVFYFLRRLARLFFPKIIPLWWVWLVSSWHKRRGNSIQRNEVPFHLLSRDNSC